MTPFFQIILLKQCSMMEPSSDINDLFDSLLLCEDQLVSKGYSEGLQVGAETGSQEGLSLGFTKGVEVGEEVGFYAGFASAWIDILKSADAAGSSTSSDKNEKVLRQLERLLTQAETFPTANLKDLDILDRLLALRAKFKLVCSLLKVVF
jgi:hypothetical protein